MRATQVGCTDLKAALCSFIRGTLDLKTWSQTAAHVVVAILWFADMHLCSLSA